MGDRAGRSGGGPVCGIDEHEWQPISFRFESQLLDRDGRVLIRQPDIEKGRVYCVCMKCHSHTYMETRWVGFYLQSPEADRGA